MSVEYDHQLLVIQRKKRSEHIEERTRTKKSVVDFESTNLRCVSWIMRMTKNTIERDKLNNSANFTREVSSLVSFVISWKSDYCIRVGLESGIFLLSSGELNEEETVIFDFEQEETKQFELLIDAEEVDLIHTCDLDDH